MPVFGGKHRGEPGTDGVHPAPMGFRIVGMGIEVVQVFKKPEIHFRILDGEHAGEIGVNEVRGILSGFPRLHGEDGEEVQDTVERMFLHGLEPFLECLGGVSGDFTK